MSLNSQASGLLDLSNQSFNHDKIHSLDGNWQIAWDNLHSPNSKPSFTQNYPFPSTWNHLERPKKAPSPYGAATLYLNVKLPENLPGIYIKLPNLPSSGVLWANGEKILEQGIPALNKENEVPGYNFKVAYVQLTSPQVNFVLQTSNFHYKEGGSWNSIKISGPSGLAKMTTLPIIIDSVLTVLLLTLGGLFISLYLIRNNEKAALYFGSFCLAIGFRHGITDEHVINQVFPAISWITSQRLEHISLYMASPLFISFVNRLYPVYQSKNAEKAFAIIAAAFSILTLFLEPELFTQLAIPFQATALIAVIYVIRVATLAFIHKRESAIPFCLSCVVLIFGVIADVLTHNMIIHVPFGTEWAATVFVILQAWLLNQRYAFSLTHIESMSQRLKEQNTQLQKIDAMKDDFLAQTSHELRTPIHGISALSELVLKQEQNIDKDSQTNIRLIHSSSIRLSNLVNDILDLSSIKHNNLKLTLTSVPVEPLIDQVTLSLRPLLKGRPVTLSTKIKKHTPNVMADEDRLQQILFNLIGNAIKFTPKGKIDVIVEETELNKIKISIRDTGLGIDHSETNEIFEAYKQGQRHGESIGGHGLGLTITRDLLTMHESELQVRSIPGHGSTFYFELDSTTYLPESVSEIASPSNAPVEVDRRIDNRTPADERKTPSLPHEEHALVIWAVDDEPVNLQIINNQITSFGYACRCFSSGQLMLDELSQQEQPDLLLLDIMMPGINGLEVCTKVREQFNSLELPIIMLTALQQTQDIVHAFDAGASDYLAKPYNQPELHARVEAQLKSSLCYELSLTNESLISEIETRLLLEKQLEHKNELLLNILNTNNTGLIIFDHEFNVEYLNSKTKAFIAQYPDFFNNGTVISLSHLLQENIKEFSNGAMWSTLIQETNLKVCIHAFQQEDTLSYSAILENTSSESLSSSEIQMRLQTLENIVSKININDVNTLHTNISAVNESRHSKQSSDALELIAPVNNKATESSRNDLIQATRLAIRLWEKYSGKSKATLAEASKIWRVYVDGGTIKTRTLDKYLNEKTLPKNPRWRSVIKTMDFVTLNCSVDESEKRQIQALISKIEQNYLS